MLREYEKITSVSNPKIKFIKSLLLRKNRSNSGYFLAEGERPCKEAIDHGWFPKYLNYNNERNKSENIDSTIEKCIQEGGLVLNVSQKILSKISKKENPQIILGVFEQKLFKINEVKDKNSSLADA